MAALTTTGTGRPSQKGRARRSKIGLHEAFLRVLIMEPDRPDVKAAREAWLEDRPDLDPGRLMLLDETWTSTNMTRLRSRIVIGRPRLSWRACA